MLDDYRWSNKTWANLSNLDLAHINTMEYEILDRLSYSTNVTKKEYDDWTLMVMEVVVEKKMKAAAALEIMQVTTIKRKRRLRSSSSSLMHHSDKRSSVMSLRSHMISPPPSP